MSIRDRSEKDLINKWVRKLPEDVSRSLPWDVLNTLTQRLSNDTLLPVDILLECIRTRDVAGLFRIADSLDVTKYTSPDLLLQDRLVVDLFSKFDFPDSPFNKREKAKFRFFDAEERCREANFRVSRSIGLENDVNSVIHDAINNISRLLGRFDVNEMLTSARFGPGSTLCVKGRFTTDYFKYRCENPTVTHGAFPYAEALLAYDHQWNAYLNGVHPFDVVGPFCPASGQGVELSTCDHNKATFVPKNAKTERSIAIEPYFNVYFQLGVGGMIRRRLRDVGIDLDSQLRNQALAREGSLTGLLATIDFSMASDTISIETVRLLLPPTWFEHLDRLRSSSYLMDGHLGRYHKFSSMGNGFTFELETLIFYSLAVATCGVLDLPSENISVFGDDVVLPSAAVSLYQRVCSYLGFTINEEKSFVSGSFRESCGEDFLEGVRVRPVFCKELGTVQHVALLANRLLALNRAVGFGSRSNNMLSSTVNLLHQRIPRDVRKLVVGPPSDNYDGYLHYDQIEILKGSRLVKWNRRLFAWEHPIIRFEATKLQRRDGAAALYVIKGLLPVKDKYPLHREKDYINGLMRVDPFAPCVSDYLSENVPRDITGRKLGNYRLGTSLVWSLGVDVAH